MMQVVNALETALDVQGSIGCFNISLANVVKTKHTNTLCALEPCYFVDGQYRYNKIQLELHWKAVGSTSKCLRAISKLITCN
ncbi:hypothetical protein QVD17_01598 [Tagetes erecta]|uniref:Uncharacterized protein n=1 Tax=Tagetes erecta TaxID=13708 RepID=A0AAD8P6Z9_TARER|nr:hypothetical protein QVD17_01598 [Tagetes erecta]